MNATKERQAWCCLQVKLCDPCLSALYVPWCEKALYINTLPLPLFGDPDHVYHNVAALVTPVLRKKKATLRLKLRAVCIPTTKSATGVVTMLQ